MVNEVSGVGAPGNTDFPAEQPTGPTKSGKLGLRHKVTHFFKEEIATRRPAGYLAAKALGKGLAKLYRDHRAKSRTDVQDKFKVEHKDTTGGPSKAESGSQIQKKIAQDLADKMWIKYAKRRDIPEELKLSKGDFQKMVAKSLEDLKPANWVKAFKQGSEVTDYATFTLTSESGRSFSVAAQLKRSQGKKGYGLRFFYVKAESLQSKGETLGEGTTGRVVQGVGHTGEKKAVKIGKSLTEDVQSFSELSSIRKRKGIGEGPKSEALATFDVEGERVQTFAMPLLSKDNAQTRLEKGEINVRGAVAILRQIKPAIESLHKKDMVHSDIKPANILFDQKGEAKLVDFGSLIKRDGSYIGGTPAFMTQHGLMNCYGSDDPEERKRGEYITLGLNAIALLSPDARVRKGNWGVPVPPAGRRLSQGLNEVLTGVKDQVNQELGKGKGEIAEKAIRVLVADDTSLQAKQAAYATLCETVKKSV